MATVDQNTEQINILTERLNTIEENSKNIEELGTQVTLDTASVLMVRLSGTSYQVSLAEIIAILNGFEIVETAVNITADKRQFIKADATSGSLIIALEPAADTEGQTILIQKVDSTSNGITIDGDGIESISGDLTQLLATQWELLSIVSDGSNYNIT